MQNAKIMKAVNRVQRTVEPEVYYANFGADMVQRPDYLRKAQGLDPFGEVGTTGLRQFGGFVLEEWLLALQGRRAAWVWREMLDNDPTVGAIMYALRWLSEGIEWPVEEGSSAETAEFVESCMHDMSHTWNDFVSEVLSFLPYGWSFHEEVMKRREGKQSGPPLLQENAGNYTQENVSFKASSAYTDGKIGWRKIPIRAQETMLRWIFNGYSGIAGMKQIDWHGGSHDIPIQKALLFRTQTTRNNPEGRALALDTPIPTPDGWRTMADLAVGSRVFDEQGRIRYVTAVADWEDRPCYQLTFQDGSSIIADENHQWMTQKVWERQTKRDARIRTTSEIAGDTKNIAGVTNHAIGWAGALDYTEQHLAIDPYVLGLWLGDGTKRAARITCHADDVEEQAVLVEAIGYSTSVRHNGRPGGSGRILDVQAAQPWVDSPQAALRALHLLENKHVPDHYLRGSVEQRLALLQGLMDADGHVDHLGRCEFSNTNLRLIDAVAELVRSLGCGCRVRLHHKAGGEHIQFGRPIRHVHDAWTVKFTPTAFVPFRLARKVARCEAHAGKPRSRQFHYIVSAERVEKRRTRCIEVDSPSHLFLAGESMVPTHNSILRNAYTSYFALKNIKAIEGIGIERDLAGIPVMTPPEGVNVFAPGQEDLYKKVQNVVTSIRRDEHEGVVLPEAGWKLELLSAGGSRQFDTDKVIRRYRSDIATSMLADFVLIGQDSVGSYAMVDVKSDLWGMALDGVMDLICEVMNRYAIPRLLELNGINDPDPPQITHGRARKIDLERVGAFLQAISLAGAPIPWSIELLKALFLDAGLPINFEEHSDPTELPTVKSPEEQLAEQRAAEQKILPGQAPQPGGNDLEARQPLAKAAQSEVADGTLIDLSPHFQARHNVLSAQLDSEISAALAELGSKAADVYGAIAEKASGRPSYGALQRVVGRVMRSLNVANWLNTRLLPILKNHAGRTAADTARTIQTQIDLEVHIGEEDARAIVAKGGEDLGMRDIEPQVRQAILKAVRQGLERGENPTRTAQRIREQVPAGRFVHAGAKYRSQLISREQTARAMRQSSLAAYKSNPNITAVELRDGIYGPPRSDQTCIARDGDIVPIERADSVHAEHILCTLSMSPVVSGTLRERVPEVLAA